MEASKNTWTQQGTNSSSGASVGVGFAGGSQNGFTIELGVSQGKGKRDGSEVSYNNTHVSGGKAVNVTSGGDLTLKGAVIDGQRVTAEVGGNLIVESLQDTSTQVSKQNSSGFNASLCIPPICYGVSTVGGGVAKSKADGDYASVTEQSGIKAGDGGFDVNVKGRTDLKGGVISSTQAAVEDGKNRFTTDTLTTSDIENRSTGSASSSAINISDDMFTQGNYGVAKAIIGNALNNGSASASANGMTKSAVSGGLVMINDDAVQQAVTGNTVAALNRDATNAHVAVERQDVESLQKNAQAEQTLKNAGFQAITVPMDDAYHTMFNKEAKFYRVTCGGTQEACMNDTSLVKMEEIDPETAKRDGKILAVNGIFNTQERAGQLAYQNASVDSKTGAKPSDITLMHIAPADTTLGEILVATYEQKMASIFGYTNADITYADALQGRGQEATTSLGHSRGTIVQTNAFNIAAEAGYKNPGLVVEGVGMAVSASTYIAQAGNVLGAEGDNSNITATYMINDPVSVIAAGNPGDAMAAVLEFYNVLKFSNSAHSCYGTGAIGCSTIANPAPGGPQPVNQQMGNVQIIRGANK